MPLIIIEPQLDTVAAALGAVIPAIKYLSSMAGKPVGPGVAASARDHVHDTAAESRLSNSIQHFSGVASGRDVGGSAAETLIALLRREGTEETHI